MSVKARLVVSIVTVLTVAFGGLVAIIATLTTSQAREDGLRYATSLASLQAEELEAGITPSARHRAEPGPDARHHGPRPSGRPRSSPTASNARLLTEDPTLLGVWSAFEPDSFDGQDLAHVGAPSSDQTGRYISYWFRDGAAIAVTPLVDYTVPGAGDYYLLPRDSGTEVALEPYAYEVAGEEVLMTSLTAPGAGRRRRWSACAGVDVPLADVQATVDAIRPYGVGRAALVSSDGVVVASNRAGDEVGSDAAGRRPRPPPRTLWGRRGGAAHRRRARTAPPWSSRLRSPSARARSGRCSSRSPRARSSPRPTRCGRRS